MFRFPFSNYQELNLDWILAKVKEFADLIPGMQNVLSRSEEALDNAEEALETANEAKEIAEQAVSSVIADGAIPQASIPDGAITTDKLASEAVTSQKLGTGAVTASKIAAGAVYEGKIATGAVTTEKIADDAVTGDKIADGVITNAMIAPDFVFPKSMQLDLIWSNPSTASSFDTQTVTISQEHIVTQYKYLMILLYSPNNGYVLFPIIAGALCPVQVIGGLASASDPFAVYQRSITAANTQVTITTCTVKSTAGTLITDPDAMKPVSLYGLK